MSGTLLVGHSLDDSDLSGHYASVTWITPGEKKKQVWILRRPPFVQLTTDVAFWNCT
jgi:hypothetical protein